MMILHALPLLVLLADDSDKGWKEAAKEDGITVFRRERADTSVAEMKAVGLIDAAPIEIWKSIRDYPNYPKTMPYTEESKILSTEGGDKVTYFYSVINAPLVDRRDYCIRILDETDWKNPKAPLYLTWKASDKCIPEKDGLVRVKLNDGYWKLEARENGAKTFATYYVFTDPGGSIPNWIANKANSVAVPNVFASIRKVIADNRAATDGGKK